MGSQVGWGFDESTFIENRILAQSTVDCAAQTCGCGMWVDLAILVTLVEEGCNLIALFELGDLGSDFNNLTRAIRARNNGETESEWVCALLNKENC